MAKQRKVLEVDGEEVSISSPDKLYFPKLGITKIEVIEYYLAVAEGAVRGALQRPVVMKRFVDGAEGEAFFQKRAPKNRPSFVETATLKFPSRRTAEEVVLTGTPTLVWLTHMGCLELNPHPIRANDLMHPDELRMDLDPVPGVLWPQIRDVGFVTREVLEDLGLVGWPKTSGSRGLHINIRIVPEWTYDDVRRAAVAIAREVERRAPDLATARWWKEERHGVFLDYNQNAKDRTVASAYSIRPTPDARVSAPVTWDELTDCDPASFTLRTMPARFAEVGDLAAGIDEAPCRLDKALALADEQDAAGAVDAPWPPHYPKAENEPPRASPSRRKSEGAGSRRQSKMPLIEIARAKHKQDALDALERWKAKHAEAVAFLEPHDVLTDAMRGRSSTWTRIRVNLIRVPAELRPEQEPLEADYDARTEWARPATSESAPALGGEKGSAPPPASDPPAEEGS